MGHPPWEPFPPFVGCPRETPSSAPDLMTILLLIYAPQVIHFQRSVFPIRLSLNMRFPFIVRGAPFSLKTLFLLAFIFHTNSSPFDFPLVSCGCRLSFTLKSSWITHEQMPLFFSPIGLLTFLPPHPFKSFFSVQCVTPFNSFPGGCRGVIFFPTLKLTIIFRWQSSSPKVDFYLFAWFCGLEGASHKVVPFLPLKSPNLLLTIIFPFDLLFLAQTFSGMVTILIGLAPTSMFPLCESPPSLVTS